MKKYVIIDKKIDEPFYPSLNSAQEEADDYQIIIEIEIKEIRRFKKGEWQEFKEKK